MANRTPHVVGGGLGSFRKEAQARHEREKQERQKREQREAVQRMARAKR